jgi:putative PIN family toxin of toxin-antitoxin system
MTVCLDTNVLLQAAKPGHDFEPIILAWLNRRFLWAVSTDILAEYREILVRSGGLARWAQLSHVLDLAERRGGMLLYVNPSFRFQVIAADVDDNKFTDCAITADADFVVTEDRHFAPLAIAGYKPQLISPMEFVERYCKA